MGGTGCRKIYTKIKGKNKGKLFYKLKNLIQMQEITAYLCEKNGWEEKYLMIYVSSLVLIF